MPLSFKGIQFPFQIGDTSFPAEATNEDLIKQSLVQIITTAPGERYMRPDLGCNVLDFVFEPNVSSLRSQIRRDVTRAITINEPRVLVRDVRVDSLEDHSEVTITLEYVIIATGTFDRLEVVVG